jgi:hypothetical protein
VVEVVIHLLLLDLIVEKMAVLVVEHQIKMQLVTQVMVIHLQLAPLKEVMVVLEEDQQVHTELVVEAVQLL